MKFFFIIASMYLVVACTNQQSANIYNFESDAIIGGKISDDINIQQAVALVVMSDGTCTGSYVGQNKILTAAHCFNSGSLESIKFNFNSRTISCLPHSIKIHPRYNKSIKPVEYDLAVVTFECSEIDKEIINSIQPLEIADSYHVSTQVLIFGYGLKSLSDEDYPYPQLNYLDFANLEQINKKKDSGFCLKADVKRTPYLGDSGGPIIQYNTNGVPQIIGVSSKLITRDRRGDPRTIYKTCNAKAFVNKAWILE